MSKSFYIKLFFLFLLATDFSTANATHIVGGVMNYRYIGNDRYEISLFVYRDCINGVPPLDDPARIRIWDGVAETLVGFSKPFDDTLPLIQPDPCARIDSGAICVNWTKYLDTLILPPNDLGYTIYYQRCCRNNTIQNLTYDSRGYGAMDWGATYTINIPPSVNNQHIQNSSPVFVNYPPVYICVNKPIVYDNHATDANGDSLVYRLCTPYSGAFPYDPVNNQPSPETPPFENVIWDSLYSESNMLGGVPLAINPVTGLLTGTPNTLGQFVVGICVDEYRNGELLTHTTRDFQFNIIDCNLQIVSSFFAPTVQCNNFTVIFQNQSSGATDYKWYFGDGDSSTLANPTHTYAQVGMYTVTLVSLNSITNTCLANYSKTISIQFKKIEADFNVNVDACLQRGDLIRFIDRSTDSFNVASWHWNFSNGDSSNLQNPVLSYNGTDTSITATLLVTSTNGCTSTITKTVKLFKKPPYTLNHILTKCTNTGAAQLSLVMAGNNIFSWSPATALNNPNIQNPTTNTNINITYYVTIKTPLSNGDTCVQRDSVQVKTINTVQINTGDTTKVCNDSVRLSVPLSAGQTVIWSTSNSFSPVIGTTANISVLQTVESQKYYVKIIAQGCEAIDSIVALYSNIIPQINLADNILQCSNLINLNATIDFADNVVWSTSATFNPVISTANPLTTTQIPKTVKYYIKANYQTCSNTDSIKVTVQDTLPIISLADTLNICGGNIRITSVVRKFTSLIWSTDPTFTTVIGTTQNINVIQSTPTQTYYIKAFYRNCFVTDSVTVNYNDTVPTIQLEDSTLFCSNTITVSAIINDASSIMWSVNPDFIPILSMQSSFTLTQTNALQKYYVKAAYRFCSVTDSISVRTQTNLPQISVEDSIYVCSDSVRIQTHIINFDSIIWSTNPTFDIVISRDTNFVAAQSEFQKLYYLKVYYSGCEITDSVLVFYNDSTPAISLSSPGRFCSDSVFAYAFVDFATETEWFDSRDFSHLIGTNLTLQITQPQGEKWYYFRAKYKFCYATDSIKLENRSIKYSKQNAEVCMGDSVTLNLNVQTASQYTVFWYVNNDTIETDNISTIKILPNISQPVYFHIDNLYGCSASDSLKINVNPLPGVDATVDKPVINIGEQVQLTATQNQTYSYNWFPANLVSNAAIFNPTSSPTQTILYTVLINDRNNCSAQDTVSVRVENTICDKYNIYIPDAFTPNGDGMNDVFNVRTSILKNMHLEVFDRWGHKVFETNTLSDGWDGTYKGQPAPLDSYGYYFTGECLQGEKISLKGNVTLLR